MTIIQATPEHNREASILIYNSGPAAFEHVFHRSHGPNIKDYLSRQFKSNKTMFSHKHHFIWEESGKAVGAIVFMTKKAHDKLFLENAISIFSHYGIRSILKGLKFELNLVKPPKKSCFYIGHIAVHPDFRGQGIARKLIQKAEEVAKEQSFNRIALDVASMNHGALGLYELMGFQKRKLNKSYNNALDDHIYMEKDLY